MPTARTADDDRLRLADVRRRTGMTQAEIARRVRRGDFPKPERIGHRTSVWPSHAVDGWLFRQQTPPAIQALLS